MKFLQVKRLSWSPESNILSALKTLQSKGPVDHTFTQHFVPSSGISVLMWTRLNQTRIFLVHSRNILFASIILSISRTISHSSMSFHYRMLQNNIRNEIGGISS